MQHNTNLQVQTKLPQNMQSQRFHVGILIAECVWTTAFFQSECKEERGDKLMLLSEDTVKAWSEMGKQRGGSVSLPEIRAAVAQSKGWNNVKYKWWCGISGGDKVRRCLWTSAHEQAAEIHLPWEETTMDGNWLGQVYFSTRLHHAAFFSLPLGHLGISWLILFMLLSLGAWEISNKCLWTALGNKHQAGLAH